MSASAARTEPYSPQLRTARARIAPEIWKEITNQNPQAAITAGISGSAAAGRKSEKRQRRLSKAHVRQARFATIAGSGRHRPGPATCRQSGGPDRKMRSRRAVRSAITSRTSAVCPSVPPSVPAIYPNPPSQKSRPRPNSLAFRIIVQASSVWPVAGRADARYAHGGWKSGARSIAARALCEWHRRSVGRSRPLFTSSNPSLRICDDPQFKEFAP